jgi:hypothetical protein
MRFRLCVCALLVGAAAGTGCSQMTIDNPKTGATNVVMPLDVQITKSGNVSMGDALLDTFNMTQVNGGNYQVVPGKLYYVPVGQHTLFVGARNTKTNQNLSETVGFTVSSCPLCYTCPTGQALHPSFGQCCDNGRCDEYAFGNFSVPYYSQPKCNEQTAPTVNPKYWYEFDCIRSDGEQIRGGTPGPARMVAVRFTASRSGQLAHIRVPIGRTSGTASARVWITADANNSPGAQLELINVASVRQQPPIATVNAPEHIFSVLRPALTAGTTYWLVIGPGAADSQLLWNHTMLLADSSIPNTTTLLLTNTNNLTGPWAAKSNLAELRPAFQIDVR